MKKKKLVIIICSILMIIVGIVMLLSTEEKPIINNAPSYDDEVNKIIKKLENKESFNLYLYSYSEDLDLKDTLKYYKKIFSINYESLKMDFSNKAYKTLLEKLEINISPSDEQAFIIIKDGYIHESINGLISEKNLRNLLIKDKVIDQKYKYIDYYIEDNDFNEYYSSNEIYNILYININNNDLFKYREILYKNNTKSLVVYYGIIDSMDTTTFFENALNLPPGNTDKLPVLIKTQSSKIIYSKSNISLDDFEKELS